MKKESRKNPWWRELLETIVPVAGAAAGSFREAARETMEEAQGRIRETTRMVVKAAVVFLIMAVGFIYILNGLGRWLEATNGWQPGVGPMVVGGVLFILGVFGVIVRR